MNWTETPNELSERGIWWQVGGFAIAGCASVAILQIWEGSDFWAYRSLAIAFKDLYWMFILPLAGAIEGVRKLFEKASEIRAAQRAKIRERGRREGIKEGIKEGRKEGRQEGLQQGRQEALGGVRERLQQAAVAFEKDPATGAVILTPEVMDYLLGETPGSAS